MLDVGPRLGSLRSTPGGGVQCSRGLAVSARGTDSHGREGKEADRAEGGAGLG